MPETIIFIPGWVCTVCDYHQDFEPTAENQARHFPEWDVPANACPACHTNRSTFPYAPHNQFLVKEATAARHVKTIAAEVDNTDPNYPAHPSHPDHATHVEAVRAAIACWSKIPGARVK